MTFFSSKLDAGVFFLSCWIILTVWSGYLWKITPLSFLASGVILYFLFQKRIFLFSFRKDHSSLGENDPAPTWLLVGSFVLVLSGIFFGLQGGYDLSADAAPSFAATLIHDTIPATYAPYFNLPFFYPPGLPAIVSQLLGVGISSYVWMWAFGVLGFVLVIYYSSKLAGALHIPYGKWIIPTLIIGLRFLLQSLLSGEYPVLLGYGIGLAAVWFGQKRNNVFIVGAGAATLLHPYAGGVAFILGWVVNKWNPKMAIVNVFGMGVIAFPMIFFEFLSFHSNTSTSFAMIPFSLHNIESLPSLVGIVPVLLLLALSLLFLVRHGKWKDILHEDARPWLLIGIGVAGALLSALFPALVFGGKVILLTGLGVAWGCALLLEKVFSFQLERGEWKAAAGLILVILLVNGTSGVIAHLAAGSKATLEEASFATWFSQKYDVRDKNVLYLSSGQAKMAQYAQTIPFDALSAHFLTSVTYTVFSNTETMRIQTQASAFKQMMKDQCISCAASFDAEYIVVNTRQFPHLPLVPLEEKNGFIIYSGKK